MPGGMRAIHQRLHAARGQLRHELLEREDQGRGRGHVVEHRQAGARRHGGQARARATSSGPAVGNGMATVTTCAPDLRGHGRHRVAAGVVLVVGGEQLVARLEAAASGGRR